MVHGIAQPCGMLSASTYGRRKAARFRGSQADALLACHLDDRRPPRTGGVVNQQVDVLFAQAVLQFGPKRRCGGDGGFGGGQIVVDIKVDLIGGAFTAVDAGAVLARFVIPGLPKGEPGIQLFASTAESWITGSIADEASDGPGMTGAESALHRQRG